MCIAEDEHRAACNEALRKAFLNDRTPRLLQLPATPFLSSNPDLTIPAPFHISSLPHAHLESSWTDSLPFLQSFKQTLWAWLAHASFSRGGGVVDRHAKEDVGLIGNIELGGGAIRTPHVSFGLDADYSRLTSVAHALPLSCSAQILHLWHVSNRLAPHARIALVESHTELYFGKLDRLTSVPFTSSVNERVGPEMIWPGRLPLPCTSALEVHISARTASSSPLSPLLLLLPNSRLTRLGGSWTIAC